MAFPRFRAVLLALTLLCAGAHAQTEFEYGFLAGANQSWLKGDTTLLFDGPEFELFESIGGRMDDGKLGMAMGLFVATRPYSGPGLRLELVYTELGGQGDFDGVIQLDPYGETDISGTVFLKTTYLELPVLAVVPLDPDTGRWHLLAGMSVAFSLRSEMRLNSEIQSGYYSDAVDLTDFVHTRDYHAVLGGEFLAVIKETEFRIGLRYKRGLQDVENGIGADPERVYKHEAIVASLGIIF